MRRGEEEGAKRGGERRVLPPPAFSLPSGFWVTLEAQTLQQQQQKQSVWGWGNRGAGLGKTSRAASVQRAGRASSKGDLVLLAALDLG